MPISELCFFFGTTGNQNIYGCSYEPESRFADSGIVIVPPVGNERLRCFRESVNLARFIAENGLPVLRFDYRGEGESYGNFADFDMKTRVDDIKSAVNELRNRLDTSEVILLGFRLGALFALKAANELNVKQLILCEPIYHLEKLIKSYIRSYIIAQRDYYGNSSIKEVDIWRILEDGKSITVNGFQITLQFLRQLQNFDVSAELQLFNGNCLLINFYKNRRPAAPASQVLRWCGGFNEHAVYKVEPVKTRFSWTTKKIWTPVLSDLNDCVTQWIKANVC